MKTFLMEHKRWFQTLFVLIGMFLLIQYLKIDITILFTDFHYVFELINEMFPPNFDVIWDNNTIFNSILQTISMAYLGTLIGGLIAFLFSIIASNNIFNFKLIGSIAKWVLSFIRVLPSLVVILIFVVAVGPGPFAGVLTIIFATIGTLGKLFTESLENLDPTSAQSLQSTGAHKLQTFKYAVWPEFVPAFISNLLYCFDINMRVAVGLGIFGGGGIGYKLYLAMRVLHYKDAVALIICIIILLLIIENLSNYLRHKILGN
jgi:phosphonate transport system permease protein